MPLKPIKIGLKTYAFYEAWTGSVLNWNLYTVFCGIKGGWINIHKAIFVFFNLWIWWITDTFEKKILWRGCWSKSPFSFKKRRIKKFFFNCQEIFEIEKKKSFENEEFLFKSKWEEIKISLSQYFLWKKIIDFQFQRSVQLLLHVSLHF